MIEWRIAVRLPASGWPMKSQFFFPRAVGADGADAG
jgi:hypothetical protein